MADFLIKQGDTQPDLEIQLVSVSDGSETVYSLADGSTVTFSLKKISDGSVVLNRQSAAFSDATQGKVKYSWASGDTDQVGVYNAEFRIVKNDGDVLSPPILSKLVLEIVAREN